MINHCRAALAAALTAGLVILVCAGCDLVSRDAHGNPTDTMGCHGDWVSSAAFGRVDTCQQATVIETALQVMFSWDPTIDASPQAGALRALPLMTPALQGANEQGPQGPGARTPGADWLWQRTHGWAVTATVSTHIEDGHPVYLVVQTLIPAPGHAATPADDRGQVVAQLPVTARAEQVGSGGFRLAQIQMR